jgi:hypothetical protein
MVMVTRCKPILILATLNLTGEFLHDRVSSNGLPHSWFSILTGYIYPAASEKKHRLPESILHLGQA